MPTTATKKLLPYLALWLSGVCAVFACGCNSKGPQPAKTPTIPARKGAANLTLKTLDGASFATADHAGKVVVIDFMATWCRPCEKAVPHYLALQKKYASDVQVVFVSQDDEADEVRRFAKRYGVDVPIGLDAGERWYKAYGVKALPTTVLIDRSGNVAATVDGSMDDNFTDLVDRWVARLVSEKAGAGSHR